MMANELVKANLLPVWRHVFHVSLNALNMENPNDKKNIGARIVVEAEQVQGMEEAHAAMLALAVTSLPGHSFTLDTVKYEGRIYDPSRAMPVAEKITPSTPDAAKT